MKSYERKRKKVYYFGTLLPVANLMLTITNHYNYIVCIGVSVQQLDQFGIIFPEVWYLALEIPFQTIIFRVVAIPSPALHPALSVLLSVFLRLSLHFFSVSGSPTLCFISFPFQSAILFLSLLYSHISDTNSIVVTCLYIVTLIILLGNQIESCLMILGEGFQFNITSKQHLRGNFVGPQWSRYGKVTSAWEV